MVAGSDEFEVFCHIDYAVRSWPSVTEGPFDPRRFKEGFRAAMRSLADSGRVLEMNTRKSDVEWINRRRLLRGAETLTLEQRTELFTKLLTADPSEEIAAAWIAKELLRDLLACTARGGLRYEIRAALYRFYKFCAACPIPEVTALARTVETWQDPIIRAVRTGLTNARSEGYNRIVKHVGRIAFGFRNPENQRRRVRWACTRRSRRSAPSRHQCHC